MSQVRSTRTEERRREDAHSSTTPQPSGDREQVGQLNPPPEPPAERRAKPYTIAFLIYELLIQVTPDRVQADTYSSLLTQVKVTNVRQSGDTWTESPPPPPLLSSVPLEVMNLDSYYSN